MNKQNKKIYTALMNRIAIALMLNQGLITILGTVLSKLEAKNTALGGENGLDLLFRLGECIVYFASFVLPVMLFNELNKNADREIYEPLESPKASLIETIMMMGISLGAITLSAYANYYIVNAFWDYSEFTQQFFWSVELKYTYQIIIYFIYSAIIPALVEELLFRETVCRVLTVYGKGTAVVASAALFALMHSNVEQLLYTFVAGLLLGWIYVETKSIVFPILLHFVNNGISSLDAIIYEKCSSEVYNAYSSYSSIFIWIFMFISLAVFLIKIIKKGSFIQKLTLKPDENGNEVAPLTISERITGFFSLGISLFTMYSIAMMVYFIYLCVKTV